MQPHTATAINSYKIHGIMYQHLQLEIVAIEEHSSLNFTVEFHFYELNSSNSRI